MKKYKHILAAITAIFLLTGCNTHISKPTPDPEPSEKLPIVAYVPLDDRPNNFECMEYMAQSLGYKLLMPEKESFATELNSKEGSKSGDRAAVYEWLMEQEEEGCDRYIIFLDQLLSGGLVNSRAMTKSEPVILSDGTKITEREMLQSLVDTLGADENNRVWLLDTVMRLAPTVGYEHWDIDDYTSVRAYCAASRIKLSDSELNIENILDNYRIGIDGAEIKTEDFATNDTDVRECLLARERKINLTQDIFECVGERENFRILYGIDDSSEENSIQRNEIEFINTLLRENDAVLSGVDDMGFKAMAGIYLYDTNWQGGEMAVRYFGGSEKEYACVYDYRGLDEIVREHMEFFGLSENENAKLQMLVLTRPADESRKAEYAEGIERALQENAENGIPTILMDASNSGYGTEFRYKLIKNVELGKIIAYSGLLDMANCTGTALSHGVARYAHLKNGADTEYEARGFMKMQADVLVKDLAYRCLARADAVEYVRGLSGNPDNFKDPVINEKEVLEFIIEKLDGYKGELMENIESSSFITSLEPYAELGWGGVELSNYRFPWHRTFEMTMDITVGSPIEKK